MPVNIAKAYADQPPLDKLRVTKGTIREMKRTLEGMIVVITGASAGIGAELAGQLAERGAKLVLAARRLDRLEALNARLGGGHLVVRCDVSNPEDGVQLVQRTMSHFGRIDTLVCNAGYGLARRVAEATPEETRAIFATNVFGTTDLIHAAMPHMLGQPLRDGWRGQVMIVSSAAARRGLPLFGAYSATKAAQLILAESLRVELASQRIAVTSVHPITTDTEFFDAAHRPGGERLETTLRRAGRQPAPLVARKMLRAIVRPRREVWPFQPVRYALAIGNLFPALSDWVMTRMLREINSLNAD